MQEPQRRSVASQRANTRSDDSARSAGGAGPGGRFLGPLVFFSSVPLFVSLLACLLFHAPHCSSSLLHVALLLCSMLLLFSALCCSSSLVCHFSSVLCRSSLPCAAPFCPSSLSSLYSLPIDSLCSSSHFSLPLFSSSLSLLIRRNLPFSHPPTHRSATARISLRQTDPIHHAVPTVHATNMDCHLLKV